MNTDTSEPTEEDSSEVIDDESINDESIDDEILEEDLPLTCFSFCVQQK